MSGAHITHATAVFCEITLAISIGVVTKIIKTAPITDKLARETTINRIKESEGSHLAWIFRGLCKISDFLNKAKSLIPYIALLGSLSVLFGLAFCPSQITTLEIWFFFFSCVAFLLICLSVYFNREIFLKTHESPEIEPAD